MSTITREFTKEQLIARINQVTAINKFRIKRDPDADGLAMDNELLAIALASLEAEPVAYIIQDKADRKEGNRGQLSFKSVEQYHEKDINEHELTATPLYTAPPAPVVPDNQSITQHFDTIALEVATEIMCDVNRRHEFLGGDVQLRSRIQCRIDEACRTAMLQGAEPVTTAYKLPEVWVACSERMPAIGTEIFYFCQDDGLRDCGIVSSSNFSGRGDAQLYVHADGYDLRFGVDITHWMPLPAAPQQEAE